MAYAHILENSSYNKCMNKSELNTAMLIPEHEVKKLLGIKTTTLNLLRSTGELPALSYGKEGRFYLPEDVVNFIADRKAPSPLYRKVNELLHELPDSE